MINFMLGKNIYFLDRKIALEYLKASISMIRKIVAALMEKLEVTVNESRIDDLIRVKTVHMNELLPHLSQP